MKILCINILYFVAITVSYAAPNSLSTPGETDTYKYVLEVNNNNEVCGYMKGVYNYRFSRLFDFRGFSEEVRMKNPAKYSEYPTSEVFEKIHWKWRGDVHYERMNKDRPIYVAEFDINNDGKDEIVVKPVFFYGSIKGPGETLLIYNKGEFDPDAKRLDKDVFKNKSGELARSIYPGLIVRPFIYKGTTYLSVYNYYPYPQNSSKQKYTDIMEIMKYRDYDRKKGWNIKDMDKICLFKMIHDPH